MWYKLTTLSFNKMVRFQGRSVQQEQADDYVIATGHTHKLSEFINAVFKAVGLNWTEHVSTNASFFRPTDIAEGHANPDKARLRLGWQANYTMEDVARLMVEERIKEETSRRGDLRQA